jgi:4-amino-4-deoxy-L-arabinose transferase-like glycosyltransferase
MLTALNDKKGRAVLVAGVLALSAISAGWTLSIDTLDNHECFVSVTSREMLQSGNWVLPTFNGQPRLQKTPLSYWLVATIAKVTGRVDEFAARLPSAVFAVLSVCAIIYFVSQWLSLRTALVCAGVWATSFGYVRYSHNARPEMTLTFFVALCFLSFYSAITAQSRKRQIAYMIVFWVSFGLGNLAKGPAPIPLVGVPLVIYIAITKQWRLIRKMLPVWGVLIFLAIMLPWPIAAAYKVNWDIVIWKREFVDRFFGDYASGNKPFFYYLPQMFMFIAPWVVFLPMAIVSPFYRVWNEKRPVMQFLWVVFVVDLAFLMLSGGKRQHYIMPMMPVMAVLIGILLDDMMFERTAFTVKQAKGALKMHIAAAFLLAAGLVAYGVGWWRQFLPAVLTTAGVIVVVALVVAVLFARNRPGPACGCIFGGLVAVIMIVFVGFINPLDYNKPSRRFSVAVAQMVPPTDNVVAYKSVSPRFVHYFGRPVLEIQDSSELDRFYQEGCWIAAFGKDLDELLKTWRFELVYMKQGVERHKSNPVAGGLFHKRYSVVKSGIPTPAGG